MRRSRCSSANSASPGPGSLVVRKKRPTGSVTRPKQRAPRHATRGALLFLLMAALLTFVAARLVWIQVVEARELTVRAEKQRMRDLVLSPHRGSIYDREGEKLAITTPAKTVYAVPSQVKDATGTADALAGALGGDRAAYLKKLQRSGSFVYIARKVDLTRAAAVERLGIDGLGLLEDSRRSYPSGELACQILGFVGIDDEGLAGIEKQYDSTLAGAPGRIVAERDPRGNIIPGGVVSAEDPVDGQDIYLTIDKDIQYQAHLELAATVKRFGAKGGSVVVMDPKTGEILAMASTPYFDPNDYGAADPQAVRNKVITDAFEPGSTIKSMTAAAAIDQGLFEPTSMFQLPPTLKVGDRTIHESHDRGAVNWSLTTIVTQSSNVGAVKIGMALGKSRLYDCFERFGLNSRTGVDFPGEARGWMPPPATWSQSTMGNLPFGQGLSCTPLQLARSMAAIANGGTLVTPHFLYRQASTPATFVASSLPAIGADAARKTTVMLTDVVKDGTGSEAAVPGYEVAGKTGTAQKPRPGGLGYSKGVYVASFAGYLPAGDPRLLIVVTVDEPSKGMYGGTVAAPAFSRIARFCVAHLKIPPAAPVNRPKARGSGVPTAGNGKVSARGTKPATEAPVVESSSSVR
ncbi:MAG: penicillin-binding protein 2 [Coriobacteriia bacterium]|nr:penicillin-binding protein 2 [Coriobacteriia bacterium]